MLNINDTTLKSLQKIASNNGVTLSYLLKHIERPDKHPIDGVAMEATLMVDMEAGTCTGRYSRSATITVL
jgi:hypothetical protein